MKIRKAVVTAAGHDHLLPLQRLVDRQGQEKSALQLILEEVTGTGISEVCLVIRPGDKAAFRASAGSYAPSLTMVEQTNPRGYGDALLRARGFVGQEPFLHLVSDHLYLSSREQSCARQLVERAEAEACSVSAVQLTRESKLPFFGAVGGKRIPHRSNLYEVDQVLEKPTPTEAEQKLLVSGLQAGHYLCMFGMHVLSPRVMTILEGLVEPESAGRESAGLPAPLSTALAILATQERYLAFEIDGARYNIGVKYGLLMAQLALALSGVERERVLAELLQFFAEAKLGTERPQGA